MSPILFEPHKCDTPPGYLYETGTLWRCGDCHRVWRLRHLAPNWSRWTGGGLWLRWCYRKAAKR